MWVAYLFFAACIVAGGVVMYREAKETQKEREQVYHDRMRNTILNAK